ncbi:GntR family transcriptional regulator [Inquilinus limosus]|uniref:GntR family transcriptional regulator n=1 Tax=Inquilinus limosus TaxID=171674 RepID=A0A211ZIN5_9PROT|nr:GntR family transcriptional regulator [Inquilinus limosus]OWJ65142.1 GntR family transcriptional regulator [Inquilinus limosus]
MTDIAGAAGKEAAVVRALEEDIIFGRLPPAARLVEDALLARFPVTRHVVRQALVELERLGIVVRERNKGAAVRALTPGEVRQIYEVRELLQRQAALAIPLPAPPELIDRLQEIQAEYESHAGRGHLRGVHECNDRFHLTLFGACGNAYLVGSIEHYMRLSLPIRAKTLADPENVEVSRRHHRLMIELLRGRDSWALAQLCIDHLQPSKQDYLARAERPSDAA